MSRKAKRECFKCHEKKLLPEFYAHNKWYCKVCLRASAVHYYSLSRVKKATNIAQKKDIIQTLKEEDMARMEREACLPNTPKSLISSLISLTDDYLGTKTKGFVNLQYLR